MDKAKALRILEWGKQNAIKFEPSLLSLDHQKSISVLILGEHLTFRYILFTALLAKLVDQSIHMRSLQAGAPLQGAYDARSLCHQVLVPFEKERLEGRLGNSNEPFLNKPSRFPMVDISNPVRNGKDRRYLNDLASLLESLNTQSEFYLEEAFLFGMKSVLMRQSKTVNDIVLSPLKNSFPIISDLLNRYLEESHEGQSAVAVLGATLKILYSGRAEVEVHPANQAGSSSNEVGDIDIRFKDKIVGIEVKDKPYTWTDINHALEKVKASGNTKLVFAIGRHAGIDKDAYVKFIEITAEEGMDLSFINIDMVIHQQLSLFTDEERFELLKNIHITLFEMRAKDEAIKAYKKLLVSFDL